MKKEKSKTIFVCSECGAIFHKWVGKCTECGAWNTVNEEVGPSKSTIRTSFKSTPQYYKISELTSDKQSHIPTGINELDRVIGGGFMKGSVTLLSGNPGIGKSTLALQIADSLKSYKILYISSEESPEQLKIRAERLNVINENLYLSGENLLDNILYIIDLTEPEMVIIDSIQTIYSEEFESSPGGVLQTRECTTRLLKVTKEKGLLTILIGHITKEGIIAGPKVLEHLVDTVILMEGDQNNFFRIIRCLKNRFGPTREIGIFEMKEGGLIPVQDPSLLFISERRKNASGSTIAVSIEGMRPLLIEIQALIAKSIYPTPQRNSNGVDYRRLTMLLAVIEKRANIPITALDIFINIVGGLRIDDPACDLAIVTSILSSYFDKPVDPEAVFIGEVGLVGEVRSVKNMETRINEAARLGFKRIYIPKKLKLPDKNITLIKIESINELIQNIFS
ncbi:MAG: DNA repair protein RadA [Candidatus Marinimicrobia bacterium]|nr:DNA repair protein RadA [Candidatus Neomarinimicrobiota bacterium]